MQKFNEYSRLLRVAVRNPNSAFVSQKKLQNEWEKLRFTDVPNFEKACHEFEIFKNIIEKKVILKLNIMIDLQRILIMKKNLM